MGFLRCILKDNTPLNPTYLSHHTHTMKWLFALATLAVLATSAMGYQTEEEGEARLGFINVGAAETAEDTGYGYASPDTGYEEPATGYGYAKRSIVDFAPVAAHLAAAQEKYSDDE